MADPQLTDSKSQIINGVGFIDYSPFTPSISSLYDSDGVLTGHGYRFNQGYAFNTMASGKTARNECAIEGMAQTYNVGLDEETAFKVDLITNKENFLISSGSFGTGDGTGAFPATTFSYLFDESIEDTGYITGYYPVCKVKNGSVVEFTLRDNIQVDKRGLQQLGVTGKSEGGEGGIGHLIVESGRGNDTLPTRFRAISGGSGIQIRHEIDDNISGGEYLIVDANVGGATFGNYVANTGYGSTGAKIYVTGTNRPQFLRSLTGADIYDPNIDTGDFKQVYVVQDESQITFYHSGGGGGIGTVSNLGNAAEVYDESSSAGTADFRTLTGTGITDGRLADNEIYVAQDGNVIRFSGQGVHLSNTGNIGSSVKIYHDSPNETGPVTKSKAAFREIYSSDSSVGIGLTNSSNTISIEFNSGKYKPYYNWTGENVGVGSQVYKATTGPAFNSKAQFRKIIGEVVDDSNYTEGEQKATVTVGIGTQDDIEIGVDLSTVSAVGVASEPYPEGGSLPSGTVLIGGSRNSTSGYFNSIAAGADNTISGDQFNFIGGGSGNDVNFSRFSSSLGGKNNDISGGNYSVLLGGENNLIKTGHAHFLGGGQDNKISGTNAGTQIANALVGGSDNKILGGQYAFIGAGATNTIYASNSAIGGGTSNIASGDSSVVLGGSDNKVLADYGLAAGRYSTVQENHDGAFVLSDSNITETLSSGANTLTLNFKSGVYVDSDSGIYINGNPVMTGSSPEDVDTLQTVTDRGNTTTNSVYINGSGDSVNYAPLNVSGGSTLGFLRGTGTVAYLQFQNSTTSYGSVSNNGLTVGNNGNDAYVFQREAASLYLGTSGEARMTIVADGKVGIGTLSPAELLHVDEGYILADGASTNHGFELRRDASDTFQIRHLGGNFTINNLTDTRKDISIDGDGNVGIGTDIPSATLDVDGGIKLLDNNYLTWRGSNTRMIANSDYLQLQVAAVDKVRITTSGVGVGTATPHGQLDVFGSQNAETDLGDANNYHLHLHNAGDDTDESIGIAFGITSATDAVGASIAHERKGAGSYGDLYFCTRGSVGSNTERMRINNAGNVGIGTVTPSGVLHVYNTGSSFTDKFIVDGSHGRLFNVSDETTGIIFSVNDAAGLPVLEVDSTSGYDKISIGEYGTNALVVSGSGVGIGTDSPSQLLDIHTWSNDKGIRLYASQNTRTAAEFFVASAVNGNAELRMYHSTAINTRISSAPTDATYFNAGNVGIGTNAPSYPLEVVSVGGDAVKFSRSAAGTFKLRLDAAGGGDTQLQFQNGGVDKFTIGSDNTDGSFRIAEGGALGTDDRLTIDADGLVGIGTNNPQRELEVKGAGNVYIRVSAPSASDSAALELNNTNELWTLKADDTASDSFKITNDGGTVLTIDTSKKVGIGVTNPTFGLDVKSGIGISGTYFVKNTHATDIDIYANIRVLQNKDQNYSDGMYINYDSDGGTAADLKFFAGGTTERMRIDAANGNVGIGTTNPAQDLHIYSSDHARLRVEGNQNTRFAELQLKNADQMWGVRLEGTSLHFAIRDDTHASEPFRIYESITTASNDSAIIIDGSGKVGIGMHTPAHKLQVSGDVAGTGIGDRITLNGTGYLLSGDAEANVNLQEATDNGNTTTNSIISTGPYISGVTGLFSHVDITGASTLTVSGNVGIGTTNPSAHLTIAKTDPKITLYDTAGANSDPNGEITFNETATSENFAIKYNGANDRLEFNSPLDGNTGLMVITRGGNVGIGTVSPSQSLSVDGGNTLLRGGSGTTPLQVIRDANYGNIIEIGRNGISTGAAIGYAADNQMSFSTNGEERIRVGSNGKVGIGTSTPASTLDVHGTVMVQNTGGDAWLRLSSDGSNDKWGFAPDWSSNVNTLSLYDYTKGGLAMEWEENGNINLLPNGGVGIGTASPDAHLNVYNTGTTSSAADVHIVGSGNTYGLLYERLRNDSMIVSKSTTAGSWFKTDSATSSYQGYAIGDNWFMGQYGYNDFRIVDGTRSAGTAALTIQDTTKYVGIGTTTPATELEVYGVNPTIRISDSTDPVGDGTTIGKLQFYGSDGSSAGVDVRTSIETISENAAGNAYRLAFLTSEGNASPTEKVTIKSDGKVGIGVTTPQRKLDVRGDFQVAPTAHDSQGMILLGASSVHSYMELRDASSNVDVKLNTNGDSWFNGGNVGIGLTNPAHTLHVSGSVAGTGVAGRITLNGTGYLLSGDSPAETQTLQEVTDNGNTTTTGVTIGSSRSPYTDADGNGGERKLFVDDGDLAIEGGKYIALDHSYRVHGYLRYNEGLPERKFEHYGYYGHTLSTRSKSNALVIKGDVPRIGFGESDPMSELHLYSHGVSGAAIMTIQNGATDEGSWGGIQFINSSFDYPRSAIFSQRTGGAYNADLTFHATTTNEITGAAYPNASERMRIKSDGNVGIGTVAPSGTLHVETTDITGYVSDSYADLIVEDSDARIQVVSDNAGSNGSALILTNVNGSAHSNWAFGQTTTSQSNKLHIGHNTEAGGDVSSYTTTQDLTITTDGTVGIGSFSPSFKLDVVTDVSDDGIRIHNTAHHASVTIHSDNSYNSYLRFRDDTNRYWLQCSSDDHLYFRPNAIDPTSGSAITFSSGGNIGIGSHAPTERLEVAPDTDVSAIIGRAHIGYMGQADSASFSHVDYDTTSNYALKQNSVGNTMLNVKAGGSIGFNIANSTVAAINNGGDFFVDTDTLFVDASTDRVGINDSSPSYALDVNGTIRSQTTDGGGLKGLNSSARCTTIEGFFANTSTEDYGFQNPLLANSLAGLTEWSNVTMVTSGLYGTRGGSAGSYTYSNERGTGDFDACFRGNNSTVSVYADGGVDGTGMSNSGVIEFFFPSAALSYSTQVGIVFGAQCNSEQLILK